MLSPFINSWYFVVIILGMFFILSTKKSLNELVRKIKVNFKNKNFDVNNQQQGRSVDKKSTNYKKIKTIFKKFKIKNPEELNTAFENFTSQIAETKSRVSQLFNLWKLYMFSYLDLFLVTNSKVALLWFYNNPNCTKPLYNLVFTLPVQMPDPAAQKEIIFSVLIANSLIVKNQSDLYIVTNIGIDFLKFINFIPQ